MCVARDAQVTQNNKFAIYLQYLKKKLSDKVDFLRADKYESSQQIVTMIFVLCEIYPFCNYFFPSQHYLFWISFF